MSDFSSFFTVFLLMLAASAFPGPSDLLVVAVTLQSGLRGSMRVILGILLGDAVFILFAIAGVHSLMRIFPGSEHLFRWFSVFILVLLGMFMLRSAYVSEVPSLPMRHPGIIQGFLITLADPTAIGFYAALLPLLTDGQSVQAADGLRLFMCAAIAIVLVKTIYSILVLQLRESLLTSVWLIRIKYITAIGILLMAGLILFN